MFIYKTCNEPLSFYPFSKYGYLSSFQSFSTPNQNLHLVEFHDLAIQPTNLPSKYSLKTINCLNLCHGLFLESFTNFLLNCKNPFCEILFN